MSLVYRVLNYLAQELIVNNLSKSRTFQRGALHVHEAVNESKLAADRLLKEAQKKIDHSTLPLKKEEAVQFWGNFKHSILQDIESLKQSAKNAANNRNAT